MGNFMWKGKWQAISAIFILGTVPLWAADSSPEIIGVVVLDKRVDQAEVKAAFDAYAKAHSYPTYFINHSTVDVNEACTATQQLDDTAQVVVNGEHAMVMTTSKTCQLFGENGTCQHDYSDLLLFKDGTIMSLDACERTANVAKIYFLYKNKSYYERFVERHGSKILYCMCGITVGIMCNFSWIF